MRITPLDVRKQEFKKVVRGLDPEEVYAFLATVADEYETVLTDNKQLRDRVLELDEKVSEYRNMEKTLRDTLLTAERVMAEARENARKEAELIVRDANVKASQEAASYSTQVERLRGQLRDLRTQRDTFLARLRALAESQMGLVDSFARDFQDEDRASTQPGASQPSAPNLGGLKRTTDPGPGAPPTLPDSQDRWRDYRPGTSEGEAHGSAEGEGPVGQAAGLGIAFTETQAAQSTPDAPVITRVEGLPEPQIESAADTHWRPPVSEPSEFDSANPDPVPAAHPANIEQSVAETVTAIVKDAEEALVSELHFQAPDPQAESDGSASTDTALPSNSAPVFPAPIDPALTDTVPGDAAVHVTPAGGHSEQIVAPSAESSAAPVEPGAPASGTEEAEAAAAGASVDENSEPSKGLRWSISRFTRGLGDF